MTESSEDVDNLFQSQSDSDASAANAPPGTPNGGATAAGLGSEAEGDANEATAARATPPPVGTFTPVADAEDQETPAHEGERTPASPQVEDPTSAPVDHDLFDSDGDSSRGRERDSSDEEEEATAPPMLVEAPLLDLPPSGEDLHLLKTTNVYGIQTQPFNSATFEQEEQEYVDEHGKRRVRLRGGNVMRWRWATTPDGRRVRESNTRFVRWSDGSLQLLLGDEVFDVVTQNARKDHTFLYAVHGIIQAQGQLTSKMALRPASLKSRSHVALRQSVATKHTKAQKVAMHAAMYDPEKEKADAEKKIQETIKSKEVLLKKQERKAQRNYLPNYRPAGADMDFNANYLEADDDIEEEDEDYQEHDEGAGIGERGYRDTLSRPRHLDEASEREAAQRLQSAKKPSALKEAVLKRGRAVSSDDEDDAERDKSKRPKAIRNRIYSSDEDE